MAKNNTEVSRVLGGKLIVNLYPNIMITHNNNCTMLIPKDNGRSMIKRNIAEMFNIEVKIPRGNGKSNQDLENSIDKLSDNLYSNLRERGDIE